MNITVRDLSKSFYEGPVRKQVLSGLSCNVRPGEIFALTGANGAGKTTFLKVLATLVEPESGVIEIGGIDVLRSPGRARVVTGLAFDAERSFYQTLTVDENFRFFGALQELARLELERRLASLCDRFGLRQWRSTRFSHCSSGIRQRMAVVRALLHDPRVLLIDELTRSLDTRAQREMTDALRETVAAGAKTCILVTHDAAAARAAGWRVGELFDGRIRELP
jgi:ABC-type multidrug transport system ATPase subunit